MIDHFSLYLFIYSFIFIYYSSICVCVFSPASSVGDLLTARQKGASPETNNRGARPSSEEKDRCDGEMELLNWTVLSLMLQQRQQ
jgi:hypothetical protein